MSNLVIIGKDLPDNLEMAQAFAEKDKTVFITSKTEAEIAGFEQSGIFATTWNKASGISAHSLIIKAETQLGTINQVLFYFDANTFASKFELDKSEEIAISIDTMISSYIYAASELLKRADQHKEKLLVSFLLKEYPSKHQTLCSKLTGIVPGNTIVSAAQAAFSSLAESFSTNVADRNYLSVLLAKCNYNNELYKNEKLIADWLNDAMDTVEKLKNPQTPKQAATWYKVGAKVQSLFSLFSR